MAEEKITMKKLYQDQTNHALENFPFSFHPVQMEFIYAVAEIKKAAAKANEHDGGISKAVSEAIIEACDEVLSGKYDDQFPTSAIQGGAGTSINMNVNEVVASYATEILKNTEIVHPLDQVNKSQSTNDVNPSALKLSSLLLLEKLIASVEQLEKSFQKKAKKFENVLKLGRTHLQDAVPTTLGAEFTAYGSLCGRHAQQFKQVKSLLLELNLGGTAIGNCINASETYRKKVYEVLNANTKLNFKPASNLMSQTSSQSDFVALINAVSTYLVDLSKISNDIRMMVSGPKGGFAELILPEMQKGSTIMPGKVNPVIPEVINQVYYWVSGQAVTVHMAARAAQFELANMLPVIVDAIITSLRITHEATALFTEKCIDIVEANEENCRKHLEESTAYATLLSPKLGYDMVAAIVKEAVKSGKTIRELVLAKKLISEAEFERIIRNF